MIHCDDENIRKVYIIAILTWFSPLSKCAHTVSTNRREQSGQFLNCRYQDFSVCDPSKQAVSSVLDNGVCVCMQDVGNVRGMNAAFAAPQPHLSVTSALAHSAGTTRQEHLPPPPLKAASVAPVTTLSVPWTPTPA